MLKQMERYGSISETTDRERHGECTQAASLFTIFTID